MLTGSGPSQEGRRNKERRGRYLLHHVLPRVGGSRPGANLAWLLCFAERDLSRLSADEWERLTEEIVALCQVGVLTLQGLNTPEAIWRAARGVRERTSGTIRGCAPKPLVAHLQRVTRQAIHEFQTTGGALLPPIRIRRALLKSSEGVAVYNITTEPAAPFIEHLTNVLKAVGDRISSCHAPDCRRLFVSRRRPQTFCSNTCRSRVAMRRMRKGRKQRKPRKAAKGGSRHGKTKR